MDHPGGQAERQYRPELTDRETQVLVMLADGASIETIARRLHIGVGTVKMHARHLRARLRTRNAAHTVTEGFRLGLLTFAGDTPVATTVHRTEP